MVQEPLKKKILKGGLLSLAFAILAGGGYQVFIFLSQALRSSAVSNSQEILNYYSAAQESYRLVHGKYGTIQQLLDEDRLYLGARGDIPWAEEMRRNSFQFRFSLGEGMENYTGDAKPVGRMTQGLQHLHVRSPLGEKNVDELPTRLNRRAPARHR